MQRNVDRAQTWRAHWGTVTIMVLAIGSVVLMVLLYWGASRHRLRLGYATPKDKDPALAYEAWLPDLGSKVVAGDSPPSGQGLRLGCVLSSQRLSRTATIQGSAFDLRGVIEVNLWCRIHHGPPDVWIGLRHFGARRTRVVFGYVHR